MHDIIIIGAGPAGLTAGIYARRANKSVLIIDKGSFGGQMTYSPKIENYPAYGEISGNELADKMVEQALNLGVEVEIDEVLDVIPNEDGTKTVVTEMGEFACKAVIVAAGAAHRRLGIENEENYVGNGISFCAVCDGAFYKDKNIAVIGGGNSAMQEALLLSSTSKKVTVIQNLAFLTGEDKLAKQIESSSNIEVIYNSVVKEIIDKNGEFGGIIIENDNGEKTSLEFDGMFVAIGLAPKNKPFEKVGQLDKYGYIVADESCRMTTPGVFVAGDCRTKTVRQITTAAADGSIAAVSACKYIDNF